MRFIKRDINNKIIEASSKPQEGYSELSDEDYAAEMNAAKPVYVNRDESGKIAGTQSLPNGKNHEKITGAEYEIETATAKLLQSEKEWVDVEIAWYLEQMQRHDYGATRKSSTRAELVVYGNQLRDHVQGDEIAGIRPTRPI